MTTLPHTFLFLSWLAGSAAAAVEPTALSPGPEPDPVTVAIATLLNGAEPLVVDGRRLDVRSLRQLYEPRGYRPVWLGHGVAGARGKQIAGALEIAARHGLDPAAYHGLAIARRAGGERADDHGALELLASDAVMRLVTHLLVGAVRPGSAGGDAEVESRPVDPQALALDAAAAGDLAAHLDGLAPQTATYRGLMEALSRYREMARAGGWPTVPAKGPAVKPGASDPAIPLLRARLSATGELAAAAEGMGGVRYTAATGDAATTIDAAGVGDAAAGSATSNHHLYDEALVEAVKVFQARHGIPADGVLGAATRAALATPVGDRIRQLVANLERARWFRGEPARRYVAVNVPAFQLAVVEDGATVLTMPVVVGRKDRQTPVLATHITELIFNPSWTVPPTLLRQDFLPKMRRNQSYAARRGLQVVGSRGLTLRQPPGPRNPLGKLKFLMPNGYAIYLHDTNAKGLMRQPRRALSSGCVRLGDALGLANRLLADDPRWTPASRKRYLAGWTTRYLWLREPVPVYVGYETAWAGEDGALQFRDDLYGRDAALAKALGQEARPARPVVASGRGA